MAIQKFHYCSILFCFSFLIFGYGNTNIKNLVTADKVIVRVGVVLDLNSHIGMMAEACLNMAFNDFYSIHSDFHTRLALSFSDSEDNIIDAAYSVLDLIENEQVQAIIGPQRSSQAKFIMELGNKAQIPIISFSATSPSLSPSQTQFFIRTAYNDSSQVKAITSLVKYYGWQEIIIIYEDTDYGNGLIPCLLDDFQVNGVTIYRRIAIPSTYTDDDITKELKNLKDIHKGIFLVHMTATTGARLFLLAKKEGMMSEGYAWLVTQGMSNLLDPVAENVIDSMEGVLGVRPHITISEKLKIFKSKWNYKKNNEPSLFGYWAYDTVWALAMAVEKEEAGILQYNISRNTSTSSKKISLSGIRTSEMGPRILKSILSTEFVGLSGYFHLVNGELSPKAFEIFNVVGKTERILGYYTQNGEFSRKLSKSVSGLASKDILKKPIWPGDADEQPKKLRIGVPKRTGFTEFINVELNSQTKKLNVTGFSADVFKQVLEELPFPLPYEFIPFVNETWKSNGTYDDLIYQIKLQEFDAVVGDVTIVANRSIYVDFTLPYSESGVSMVVLTRPDERDNMWIFLRPLSWKLWLTIAIAFMGTGCVVWILEHPVNTEFRGSLYQQISTTFLFSFSTLVFAQRERLLNRWARFVVVIWFFVVLILSQSYTANLASILTVKRTQPTFVDIKEIQRNGYFVGYQEHSFVKALLVKDLGFKEEKLISYSTAEEFRDGLSKGISNGGVAAIFDEIPYIKHFLARDCSKFQMVGPIYKTDGFGFAFPLGSPLVSYMSRAILNVTEDKQKMDKIERAHFGGVTSCEDQSPLTSPTSLSVSSFGGLFIITGVASGIAVLVYFINLLRFHWAALENTATENSVLLRFLELAKKLDQVNLSSTRHLDRVHSRVHPTTSHESSVAASPDGNVEIPQDHAMALNITGNNGATADATNSS